ncbi:UPF0182 family protein, partial [Mycobacterium tuberculosis]
MTSWEVSCQVGVFAALEILERLVRERERGQQGQRSFGIVDPEFGYDIGFFVFDLPFYRSVLNWLFV